MIIPRKMTETHISFSRRMALKISVFLAHFLTSITYKSSLKINEFNNCHAEL